jgi:hypothetical protein
MTDIEQGWQTIAWHRSAMAAIEQLSRSGETFSIDDVVELAGPPIRPHQASTVFGVAARLGLIVKIGGTVGERGRLVRIWVGAR